MVAMSHSCPPSEKKLRAPATPVARPGVPRRRFLDRRSKAVAEPIDERNKKPKVTGAYLHP